MSTVVAAPPGKKKRLRKAIAGAAVALLIFLGVAALYLNSDSFRKSVRNKVVAQLEHMTGGKVELQSLDWKWTSLHRWKTRIIKFTQYLAIILLIKNIS